MKRTAGALLLSSLAVLPVCLPVAARAQTTPSPAPSAVPEIGRVSTSDRQDEPLGATTRVTYVVTKATMLRYGYTDVASAIASLPGVVVRRYGLAGSGATVSIRGSSSNGVLVLLDGRPVSGSQLGAVDIGAIATTGVERIEIVEGAGATLYGTGATAGVVNIITSHAAATYAAPLVTLADGSFADRRIAIETPVLAFSREVATNRYDYPALGAALSGTRSNADAQTTTLRATSGGTFGAVRVSGSAGITARHIGVPGSTDFLTPTARQDDTTGDVRAAASLVRGRTTTTLDLSATREALTFRDTDPNDGGPFLDYSTEARVQASLRNVVASETNRLVYGLDLARGVARNDSGFAFTATPFAQSAAYVQESRTIGTALRAYAGIRAERDGGAGGAVAPSLGASAALGNGAFLRANAATAFRVPTAEDLTYPGFSNPLLVPERTKSFDVTLDATRLLGGASLGWFVQTANDLIVLNPAVDFAQPFGPANEPLVNAQQASIAGFTFAIATAPYRGFVTRVNVTDLYRAFAFGNGTTATRLGGRPVIAANLDLGYTGSGSSALAAAGVIAHVAGAGSPSTPLTAYTRIDAYARFRLAARALLTLRAFNLGDERYQEIGGFSPGAGYPLPGRAFRLELSTR